MLDGKSQLTTSTLSDSERLDIGINFLRPCIFMDIEKQTSIVSYLLLL